MSRVRVRAWAERIKVGDLLDPRPLWNLSERDGKLADLVPVLSIRRGVVSETGTMVTVPTVAGGSVELDASWFEPELT